jgi:cytochrome P450
VVVDFYQLFGYLLAGHDTSATVLQWGVKFLSLHADVQQTLQRALREHFPDAHRDGRMPAVTEITSTTVPYLEAVLEEIIRHGAVVPQILRESLCDTYVLGKFIPKGTIIFMSTSGPGYLHPSIPVDENSRSESSRSKKGQYRDWDPMSVGTFMPERWLRVEQDANGQERVRFDVTSGPFLNFGGGKRGCFGKRLGYLELRITLLSLAWAFEFREVTGEIASLEPKPGLTWAPKNAYVKVRSRRG